MGNPMYGLIQQKKRQKPDYTEHTTEHYLVVSVPQPDDINLRQTTDISLEVRTNCDSTTTICRLTPKSPELFIDELLFLIFPNMTFYEQMNQYANEEAVVEEITCEIDLKVFEGLGFPGSIRTYFKGVVTKLLQHHMSKIHQEHHHNVHRA